MTRGTKWLLGCGGGCLVLVAVPIIFMVVGSAWLVREATAPMERAVEIRQRLSARFGDVDVYTPPPDLVSAQRLEVFLQVREQSQAVRTSLAGRFRDLAITPRRAKEMENQGVLEKLGTAWKMTRSGFAMAPETASFFEARNDALLDHDMGLGEYTWLYALSYWAASGHSPAATIADAPDFEGAPGDEHPVGFEVLGSVGRHRVRENLVAMVHRALASLPDESGDGTPASLRDVLQAESDRLEADPERMPWQDGLPPQLAGVYAPYRDRLAATWVAATNPFELAVNRKTGFMSYRLE